MRLWFMCAALIGVSTLSFWAGQTGRGWLAIPVGVLIAAICVVNDVLASRGSNSND